MAHDARTPLGVALLALAGVLGTAAAPGPAAAQDPAVRESRAMAAQPTADSAIVLASARKAQAAFERVRRGNLPLTHGTPGSRCDETVGRYCYWDDDDTSEYTIPEPPPREAARIAEARAVLLARLDSATAQLPGDDWLAGQHVRYLIEAGESENAATRARSCAGTAWWCSALLGLAHHAAWRHAAADSAFTIALATMPDSTRCEWTDLSMLLADSVSERYRRLPCAERDAINEWIWWLGDPLHLRAGNDRRTEHHARLTMSRIQRGAASGYGVAWRDDLGELLRRYGWPSHFKRTMPQPGRIEPPGISAYHRSPSYHFLADGDPVRVVNRPSEGRWTLRPVRPRERYAPPYATFATLRQLTTLFRRGDSLLIVAAYDARDDTLMPAGPLTVAMTAAPSPSAPAHQVVRHDAPAHGTITMVVADVPLLASIEVIGGNRAHRARLGLALANPAPRIIRISDIGFFTPGGETPETLDAFLATAGTSPAVHRGGKLGLFWELYGLREADDEMVLRVQVIREGRSWLRRAGERIGLIGKGRTTGFGWREDARGGASIAPRSVVVDLAGLDPGHYRIEVSLVHGTDAPITASRDLEIIR